MMKKISARCGLVLAGVIAAVLLAEMVLKFSDPYGGLGAARELAQFRKGGDSASRFMIDPDFGFRPVLGTDMYSEYGTLTNSYALKKKDGVERVLFIGDSVTARGFIVDALRNAYETNNIEYWNAGVESFNTVQEVRFYKRFNSSVNPDHVVLTFHMNDFETTPVAFRDRKGRLIVYAPNFPVKEMNPWLFRNSLLYRIFLGFSKKGNRAIDEVMAETEASLIELKHVLEERDIRFTVLVLPFLKPLAEWQAGDRFARKAILEFLVNSGIHYYDLLDTVEQVMRDGVDVRETPDDEWHPGREASARIAEQLKKQGLLAETRKN